MTTSTPGGKAAVAVFAFVAGAFVFGGATLATPLSSARLIVSDATSESTRPLQKVHRRWRHRRWRGYYGPRIYLGPRYYGYAPDYYYSPYYYPRYRIYRGGFYRPYRRYRRYY